MNMPGINIFLMMPKMDNEKKKSVLSETLKNKKDDLLKHQDMMMKLSDMIREVKSLPHIAHAGGG